MPFEYTRRVQYHETDQMGVMHHAVFFRWLEEARTEFLITNDIPYSQMEKGGLLSPVLDMHMRFLRPARYEDILTVHVWIRTLHRLKFTVDYEIVNQNGDLLATGDSQHGFIDQDFKPLPLDRHDKRIYEVLERNLEPRVL